MKPSSIPAQIGKNEIIQKISFGRFGLVVELTRGTILLASYVSDYLGEQAIYMNGFCAIGILNS